jgi:hypothetical protein
MTSVISLPFAPKKVAFLNAYARTCNVTAAADVAGIERRSHYNWLKADPEYVKAYEAAQEEAVQLLEDEAVRRAYVGVDKPVTVAGRREVVKEYSDTLLIFLLKGARPAKYRERFDVRAEATYSVIDVLRERFARQANTLPAVEGRPQ